MVNALDEKVKNWFEDNAGDYFATFRLFWCIGYLDYDALMNGRIAKGYMGLETEFEELEPKNQLLAGLDSSRNHLLKVLTKNLPRLFADESFPKVVWSPEEQDPAFRLKLGNKAWNRSKWTPR